MKYIVIAEEQAHMYDYVMGVHDTREAAAKHIEEITPYIHEYCYHYVKIQAVPDKPFTGPEADAFFKSLEGR